jgi:hypothetical protein
LGAVEEALAVAEKHGDRSSESLTALVAEARAMLEQARAMQAKRVRAATEEAEAAAAVEAAAEAAAASERLRLEEQASALTLVMQSAALQLQQVQAQQRRATFAPPGGEAVRNVPGRAHGSHHHPVRPPVRVRGVCGVAEAGGVPCVSFMPGAHHHHHQGVPRVERTTR